MATAVLGATKATSAAARAENRAVLRKQRIQRAASLLKQVSDPTRIQVISLLSERERHVGGLCEELTQSQPAVSHHLTLLRLGGIVERRRQGKNNLYRLTGAGERLSRIVECVARRP
jgi:DNA-binding transcriptional ArsR family regulator